MFFFIDGEVIVSNVITMKVSNQAGYSEVEKSLVRLKAENVGILGEMSVFEAQPRSATVKAYEPCVLYEIEKEEFEEFIFRYPDIGRTDTLQYSDNALYKGTPRQQGYPQAHHRTQHCLSK
jgi:hypothetical protein